MSEAVGGTEVGGTEVVTIATGLVTVIVGDMGRSSGARGRTRRPAAAGATAQGPTAQGPTAQGPTAQGPTGEEAPPGPRQWSCQWFGEGPGPVFPGCDGEPALTLTLSPGDAELIRQGRLAPSVAFMQGRLKTSGDNSLLLRALAWSATPAFASALASWASKPAGDC